jgi:hypothetical protein
MPDGAREHPALGYGNSRPALDPVSRLVRGDPLGCLALPADGTDVAARARCAALDRRDWRDDQLSERLRSLGP